MNSTMKYALIESKTATTEYIIHVFAFFVFSSSQLESIYITQEIISAITAKTATYLISSDIIVEEMVSITSGDESSQPGSQTQFISGILSHCHQKTSWFIILK